MSSKFENALKNTLNDETACTENGACGFKTTGNPLLDINFKVSSLRSMSETQIEKLFSDAFYFNPLLATKWLFFLRDVRSGMGERRSFRICFNWLAKTRPELVKKLIPLVCEYGRFDDLLCLFGTSLEADVIDYIDDKWADDVKAMESNKPVSLLAKWLPSINTSSVKSVAMARKIASALNLSEKQYRKTLSKLRAYLKVVEQKMSAKEWNEIKYDAVPSKANVKYNAAFLRNDEIRRRMFLAEVKDGTAKINSATNFPSDIVHAYINYKQYNTSNIYVTKDDTLEALWQALPDYTKGIDSGSTIVVADSSGSMTTRIGKTSMTAMEVAYSLAIYFAEKLTGPFKDKTITFSKSPKYLNMSSAKTLAEKLSIMFSYSEIENTNIEAVFDLILETAVRNNLAQHDIPSNILIISDMEFDAAQTSSISYASGYGANQNALFKTIEKKWSEANYKFPRLIFWNVNSRTNTIPLQQNNAGVILVSGYSPAIAKMVFSSELDPYKVLIEAINDKRYDIIEESIKDII